MRNFTKLLLTAALLIVGVVGAKVYAEVKTYWEPSSAFGASWNGETKTMSWEKNGNGWYILYTGFTPAVQSNTTEVNLSEIYTKMHINITSITGADKLQLHIKSTGKDEKTIDLVAGETDIVFSNYSDVDFSKVLEITLWGTLSGENESGSAVIDECYLYTNRYEYQKQDQEVFGLGSALSLSSVVSEETLVSIAAGENILYGTHADNQIYLKSIEEAISACDAKGANESTYRFRISEATDEGLVYPSGITTLYRIQAFKGDGSVKYTGPWGGDSYLNDIGWTYNIAGSDDGCYFAITPVDGKENTYKISSYKKDGTQRHADIYDKSEWIFNVMSKTTKQVDVLVEIQVEDTEDPGIPAVADGWISLITNGKLDGDDVTNFRTKNEDGNEIAAVIDATGGRNGGRGIKVVSKDNATYDWGTQFFIKSSQYLKKGQKVHIEFDYRADKPAESATQAHRNPGDYNCNIGNINFTVNWKHFNETIDLTADMTKEDGFLSFGMNLSQDKKTNNFYFDNLVMWTEDDPLKPQKLALEDAIAKGEAQNPYAKTTESFETLTEAISAGKIALAADDATESSLTNATTAIENAINGLKLQNGYTNLTKDMYKRWDSDTQPTSASDASGACAFVLNSSIGQPYGDGSVKWYHFADISDFTSLTILATDGTPRVMMNRAYADSGDGGDYVQLTDAPVEGKVTIDLTAYDYAHMNAIKGANWANVTVTGMYLYRTLTVGDSKIATFGSLYKNAKLNGVKAYAATYADGKVTLTEIESGNVPAGKGVVVEAAEAASYAPTFDVEAEDIESDLLVSNGTVKGDDIYVLAKKEKGLGFYKLAATDAVPAGKAYLKIEAPASETAREFIAIAGETTGIETVKTIKAEQGIFNMAGQRLVKAQKGLNIINGKKVIK